MGRREGQVRKCVWRPEVERKYFASANDRDEDKHRYVKQQADCHRRRGAAGDRRCGKQISQQGSFLNRALFRIGPLIVPVRLDFSAFPLIVGICRFATRDQDLIIDGSDASYN